MSRKLIGIQSCFRPFLPFLYKDVTHCTKLQETADLVTLTEEILNGKLHFLCSDSSIMRIKKFIRKQFILMRRVAYLFHALLRFKKSNDSFFLIQEQIVPYNFFSNLNKEHFTVLIQSKNKIVYAQISPIKWCKNSAEKTRRGINHPEKLMAKWGVWVRKCSSL